MQFWSNGPVTNMLFLAMLLLIAAGIRHYWKPWQAMAIPDSMTAGLMGLALGPTALGIIPFQIELLETIVYHALALVFITVALQTPARGQTNSNVKSMAFSIPVLAVIQGILGLMVVVAWGYLSSDKLHPGFGMLLPLSFSQGPGQALSIGRTYESFGIDRGAQAVLENGGQLGLIYAVVGLAWCCFLGVPLVRYARRKGWMDESQNAAVSATDVMAGDEPQHPQGNPPPGAMDPLTFQIVAVGACYGGTWAVLTGLTAALGDKPKILAALWSFHFLVGLGVATLTRLVVRKSKIHNRLDDDALSRIAGLIVDVATAAALSAVRLTVLKAYLLPIVVMTVLCGSVTLFLSLWVAKRSFPTAPFEHALVLYGNSTGTLPTALALLRIVDPDFKGPAASSAVLGSAGAAVLGVPLLVLLYLPMKDWPEAFPTWVLATIAALGAYLVALLVGWKASGALKLTRPFNKLWPSDPT